MVYTWKHNMSYKLFGRFPGAPIWHSPLTSHGTCKLQALKADPQRCQNSRAKFPLQTSHLTTKGISMFFLMKKSKQGDIHTLFLCFFNSKKGTFQHIFQLHATISPSWRWTLPDVEDTSHCLPAVWQWKTLLFSTLRACEMYHFLAKLGFSWNQDFHQILWNVQ